MNRDELKKILPHREPMLLVDEAEVDGDGKAQGRYLVKGDEWFLQGHFPNYPIVPGVILCEMMAQVSAVVMASETAGKRTLLVGMDEIRVKQQVVHGDTVEFTCELERSKPPFYFIKGEGKVNGKRCISGKFSVALVDG